MAYDYDAIVAGLVYNRTSAVNYSYTDRNRVETATAAMAELVTNEGYWVVITTKTNWDLTTRSWANWVSLENITRYLDNVKAIERVYYPVAGVELPEDIYFDFNGANAIERFLAGIPAMVEDMVSRYRRCNTFRCGT